MSKVLVTDTYLTNIADAIRSKKNVTTEYLPSEMATAINGINVEKHTYVYSVMEANTKTKSMNIPSGYSLLRAGFSPYTQGVAVAVGSINVGITSSSVAFNRTTSTAPVYIFGIFVKQ